MSAFFTSPGDGYGFDTLLFVVAVAVLALPVAALLAASLLEEPLRRMGRQPALAPQAIGVRPLHERQRKTHRAA